MNGRRTLLVMAIAALAVALALPALAAEPSAQPGRGNADKVKVAKDPITVTGTVRAATDADGETVYSVASGGTTYTLDAGPAWFHGDDHPLAGFVGDSVTIDGEKAADSTEIDVHRVNGTALREPGKPPWAGGWKRVGAAHPGWSQEKADRFEAKFGDCFPPGQCKTKPNRGAPDASPAP